MYFKTITANLCDSQNDDEWKLEDQHGEYLIISENKLKLNKRKKDTKRAGRIRT